MSFKSETYKAWVQYCIEKHESVNQKYGGRYPYDHHLSHVANVAERFLPIYFKNNIDRGVVMCAAWGHDLLEDVHSVTYNTIKDKLHSLVGHSIGGDTFTINVCEAIFLCTDHKGRDRNERKPPEYYRELNMNEYAEYVKLCDIIANTMFSFTSGSSMYERYKKEIPSLRSKIGSGRYGEMYDLLEKL
jgi:hypothetical protein